MQEDIQGYPKTLQLDVVECIGSSQDCILIAGCGWGKTLVYTLPLVIWRDRIIIVISPLRVLIQEQQQSLQKLEISSVALLSGGAITRGTIDDVADGKYRAVFMTPEIIFDSPILTKLWSIPKWQKRLQAVVLDEAHCVCDWGNNFRTSYGRIAELRSKDPRGVAFIAVSATLPSMVLEKLRSLVQFKPDVKIINVGNDRPNIRLEVRHLSSKDKSKHLAFLLLDLKKTIIYFQTKDEIRYWYKHLKQLAEDKFKIAEYHADFSEGYKQETMEHFKRGDILILLATEAAGMGCAISDILRVVQYKCPSTISTLVQRLGRAARNPQLQGQGILLVPPPSVDTKFPDENLANYIMTKGCRRKVLNDIFDNKPQPNENCCDICHPVPEPLQLSCNEIRVDTVPKVRRTAEQKEAAKEAIKKWRLMVYKRDYEPAWPWLRLSCVLTDALVDKLGEKFGNVTSPESVTSITGWTFINDDILTELANLLINLNKDIDSVCQPKMQPQLQKKESHIDRNGRVQKPRPTAKPKIALHNMTSFDFSKRGNPNSS